MTAKPSRARRSATYRPMPPDAPVTRATLACTSVIDVLPLGTGLSAASRASTLVFGSRRGPAGGTGRIFPQEHDRPTRETSIAVTSSNGQGALSGETHTRGT